MKATSTKQQWSEQRVTAYTVAVILTFCIVFALFININSNKTRLDALKKAEAINQNKQVELTELLEQAEEREHNASKKLSKAEDMLEKYDLALKNAQASEIESKSLIAHYAALTDDLAKKVDSSELLLNERKAELEKVKELREKTIRMRDSVVTFYRKTKAEKEKAAQETEKATLTFNESIQRLNKANSIQQTAEQSIHRNTALESQVRVLEGALTDEQMNNNRLKRALWYRSQGYGQVSVY